MAIQTGPPPYNTAIKPYSTWRHLKSGRLYTVLGVSVSATNGAGDGIDQVVVYVCHLDQKLWHRKLTEFVDGRFEPLR